MQLKKIAAVVAATLAPLHSHAVELDINGFLTAGAAQVLEDDIVYEGIDDDVTFDADSRFGLQFDAAIDDEISATAQFISRGDEDYDVEVEWAYVAWQFADNTKTRLGRMRSPLYMLSDYIDVGYAYHWVRPPSEVYAYDFLSNFEGVDLIHHIDLGEWGTEFQAFYGREDGDMELFGSNTNREMEDWIGLNITTNWNWLTLRAGYNVVDLTLDIEALDPVVENLDVAAGMLGLDSLSALGDSVAMEDSETVFMAFGMAADFDSWFARAEYTDTDFDDDMPLGDEQRWYVTAGYRWDALTFHATYAEAESDEIEGLDAPVPGGVHPDLDMLKAGVAMLNNPGTDDSSITVGVRWDAFNNTAFKIEYQDVEQDDEDFGVVSMSVDVVF